MIIFHLPTKLAYKKIFSFSFFLASQYILKFMDK